MTKANKKTTPSPHNLYCEDRGFVQMFREKRGKRGKRRWPAHPLRRVDGNDALELEELEDH
eukprot:1235394-Rhodomonas_salina.7